MTQQAGRHAARPTLRTGCQLDEIGENEDMKFVPLLMVTFLSPALLASDKETTKKPQTPLVIPVTGAGQSTTTKLDNTYLAGGPQ
jgi:hypothetical protein